MNIYQTAMQMEKEGKAMYKHMLTKAENKGERSILNMLIRMEENHYEIFEAMEEKHHPVNVKKLSISLIDQTLLDMKQHKEQMAFGIGGMGIYEQAINLEKTSESRYRHLADEAASKDERHQFLEIAEEEHKHLGALRSIVDFIKAPEHYPAFAEFSQPDDV